MNSCQQGRSMIEMLGVLAIVGVLSVGGIAGYSKAMAKVKLNKIISQISELSMSIRSLYSSQHSFAGINNGILIKTGVVPAEMLSETSSTAITHAYDGKVQIFESKTANGTIGAYEIYFMGLPKTACIPLSTMDWGQDPASGFQSIYVGPEEITEAKMVNMFAGDASSPENNIYTSGLHADAAPLTIIEAMATCSCVENDCVIGLKYL